MEWPIVVDAVVRDQLVARVSAQRSRVQLVRGPSGIGKSTLAAAVAGRLAASGHQILPVVAMPELRDVPLGALAPLLASTGAPITESTGERLQRLFSLASSGGPSRVLLVDDGPLLDEVSASTVYQLVRLHGMRCVMTARTEHPLTGPLLRLDQEGLLEATELAGLAVATAGGMVQTALGGPVEPESLHAIVDLAGGNPLFLRELVLAAIRDRVVSPGPFGLVVDAAALPLRLRDTIALRFTGLGAEQRALAELIALAEPLPEVLLPTPELLPQLDAVGLVARASDGEVYLAHPLFAETLIGLMTPEQRDRGRIGAARRLLGGAREDHRFKAICLLAESTAAPSSAELTWAAGTAFGVDDQVLAVRLSTQAIDRAAELGEAAPFDALLVRAMALSAAGRAEAAEEAFAVVEEAAADDRQRIMAAVRLGFHLAVRRQRPADAVRMGQALADAVDEGPDRDYLAVNLAKWYLMAGDSPPITPITTKPGVDPITAFNAELYWLTVALFSGDLPAARRTIVANRRSAEEHRTDIRHGVELLDFAEFLILGLDGRIDEALEFGRRARGEFFDESVGMWNYGLALFALHRGEADEALELATAAQEQLAWRDFLGARSAAVALRATAAARLGRDALAAEILDSLDSDARVYLTAQLQADEAEAWRLVHRGDTAGAAAIARAALERGIESRYFAVAVLAAYVAVRVGHADAVLEQLRTAAGSASSGFVDLVLAHAEALAAGDAPALLAVANRLAEAGLRAGAVDAARQAADIERAAGRDRPARRASLLATSLSAGLSSSELADPSITLSPREWDVAVAAAGRERNREIAERLGLSVRTVENHLTNIFRKLGVSGRDELRDELAAIRPD